MATIQHILIAHDHHAVRGALVRAVEMLYPSALISAVANGAEALATYLRHDADLLITDGHMPSMGGVELIRALRARQSTVPILMISFDVTLEVASRAAGANDFLHAPVGLADLRRAFTALLPP